MYLYIIRYIYIYISLENLIAPVIAGAIRYLLVRLVAVAGDA